MLSDEHDGRAKQREDREPDQRPRRNRQSEYRVVFGRAQAIGLELMDSATPIQPILIGDSGRALQLSQLLRERGLLVTAIRPPTVPAGSARLRVTLSAAHSLEQLELLLEALAECWPLLTCEAAEHA